MAFTESEEFRQTARECLHRALETADPEIKASYEDLAEAYRHLADKMIAWAAWIEAERLILDAARFSLANQKAAVSPSAQRRAAAGPHPGQQVKAQPKQSAS